MAQNTSEHWLTAMKCIQCKNTPNVSPLYKCNLGHIVCMSCYTKIVHRGVPRCTECDGINFQPIHVSPEFLLKLKVKPGIGRSRRYSSISPQLASIKTESRTTNNCNNNNSNNNKNSTITLEELFGLTQEQLRFLFDENVKCKGKFNNNNNNNELGGEYCNRRLDTGDMGRCAFNSYEESSKIWKIKNRNKLISICDSTTNVSRKPLVCPHSPCGKIIAQSSFDIHFKYEHGDIPRFDLDRGKELHLIHDISVITHGSSFCLGLITVYESTKPCVKPNISLPNKITSQKTPSCTFWLMVSAPAEERRNRSYVIYWMLSNNDDRYNCTLELSSQDENTVCSCFCSTTGMHESLDMDDIAQKMKCLYLTYGSLSNLLGEGPKLNFRITVH